eukprot:2058597-Rhodomonas_salina.1
MQDNTTLQQLGLVCTGVSDELQEEGGGSTHPLIPPHAILRHRGARAVAARAELRQTEAGCQVKTIDFSSKSERERPCKRMLADK